MNKIFNFNRFGKYFIYDLNNAKNNFGLSLIIMALMPLICFFFYELGVVLINGSFTQEGLVTRSIAIYISVFCTCLIAPSKLYGHLTDKRAGTEFLMLPASKTEKWLSMVLITCIVIPILLIAALLLCDFSLGIIFPNLYGSSASLIKELRDFFNGTDIPVHMNLTSIACLCWIETSLIFTLGAICFKKSKIAKTLLCEMLVGILFGTLSVSIFGDIDIEITNQSIDEVELMKGFNVFFNVLYSITIIGGLVATFLRIKTIKH